MAQRAEYVKKIIIDPRFERLIKRISNFLKFWGAKTHD